jgi:hypothetical protein
MAVEDKIAKLLRLANNEGATEAEATAAAEAAQKLMLRHGIEMAQISLEEDGGASGIPIGTMSIQSKLDPWRVQLANGVAESTGGKVVFRRAYGKWHGSLDFFGPEGSTEGMVKLYVYLEAQCDRISKLAASLVPHEHAAASMRWRRSYLWGMVARLQTRLMARVHQEAGTGMEMVLVKSSVDKKIEEHYPELRSEKTRVDFDPFAAEQGHADGGGIALGDDELVQKTIKELML